MILMILLFKKYSKETSIPEIFSRMSEYMHIFRTSQKQIKRLFFIFSTVIQSQIDTLPLWLSANSMQTPWEIKKPSKEHRLLFVELKEQFY